MKSLKFFAALAPIFLASSSALAANCSFDLDTHSVEIAWTAFKTNQKIGVGGTFTEVILTGATTTKGSLNDFLSQLKAEIPLKDHTSITTANPARDLTLFEHFFVHFKETSVITGTIHDLIGNDSKGDFQLHLKMNQKEVAVPMSFTRDKEGHFVAKGGMDVADFGLEGALEDLHKTCEKLHSGVDGISKTWPIVEIKLIATIPQKCKS